MRRDFDPADYSAVVKLRGDPPRPWRWEIYCAGKRSPIEHSDALFETSAAAHKAGKQALSQLIARLSL
jgi:hypothetical protein